VGRVINRLKRLVIFGRYLLATLFGRRQFACGMSLDWADINGGEGGPRNPFPEKAGAVGTRGKGLRGVGQFSRRIIKR